MSRTQIRIAAVAAAGLALAAGAAPALAATKTDTDLSLKVAKTMVAPKAKDTLTGTLTTSKGKDLAKQSIRFEERAAGSKSSYKVLGIVKTNAKGVATLTVVPGTKAGKVDYVLVFASTATDRGSHSKTEVVTVS